MPPLTAHVLVADDCTLGDCESLLAEIDCMLRERYGIGHATIQLERTTCVSDRLQSCSSGL